MQHTVFETPVVRPALRSISRACLKISAYYANVTGKYPEKMSPPAIKPASLKKTGSSFHPVGLTAHKLSRGISPLLYLSMENHE
jgi:hypothetical protein